MTYDVLEGYNLSLQKTVVDLENATEAAIEMPEAFIELSVKQIASNQLLISMINSCNYIPQKTVTGEFISQKKNSKNHGIGMRSIKKIVKKYNGSLDTYYKDDDHTFHTIITMSKIGFDWHG